MSKTSTAFQATLREWADEHRSGLKTALPTPEDLAAYREGKLAPEAEEAVQERFALQPEAARELLDLEGFGDLGPPEGHPPVSDQDVSDALEAMKARLRAEGLTAVESSPATDPSTEEPTADILPFLERRVRTWRSTAWAFAVAALLAIVAGGAWIARLQAQLDAAPGIQYSKIVDLRTTRGAKDTPLSPHTEWILLIFNDLDMRLHAEGHVEIRSVDGEVVHRLDFTSSRDEDHFLNVHVPRDQLPDGTYRIRVFGDSEDEPVKEYLYRFGSSGS